MIKQYLDHQQEMFTTKKWLDKLEVMEIMQVDNITLEIWRELKVIAWCDIANVTYYDATDIEWLQAIRMPSKN